MTPIKDNIYHIIIILIILLQSLFLFNISHNLRKTSIILDDLYNHTRELKICSLKHNNESIDHFSRLNAQFIIVEKTLQDFKNTVKDDKLVKQND